MKILLFLTKIEISKEAEMFSKSDEIRLILSVKYNY